MKVESASKQCHDYSNYKEGKKEKKTIQSEAKQTTSTFRLDVLLLC